MGFVSDFLLSVYAICIGILLIFLVGKREISASEGTRQGSGSECDQNILYVYVCV